MDLKIRIYSEKSKTTKNIEFYNIKDFNYNCDTISFIEYGRLSETIILTKNVYEFQIISYDNYF